MSYEIQMSHGSALRALPSGLKHEFSILYAFLLEFAKDIILAKASPKLVLQSHDFKGGMFFGQAPKTCHGCFFSGVHLISQFFLS